MTRLVPCPRDLRSTPQGLGHRLVGLLPGVFITAPLLGLILASVVDHGPDGSIRWTISYWPLMLLDPYIISCLVKSLLISAVTTLISLAIGLPLSLGLARMRIPGRTMLTMLAWSPILLPAPCLALGIRLTTESIQFAPELDSWIRRGSIPLAIDSKELKGLLAWIASGVIVGVPIIGLGVGSRLQSIDRSWIETARTLGAGRRTLWTRLTWPLIRPGLFHAAMLVGIRQLVDPSVPILFGIRKSIAFLAVELALEDSQGPRVAILGLITAALSLLVVRLARRLGGPDPPWPDSPNRGSEPVGTWSWLASGISIIMVAGWTIFGLWPGLEVVSRSLGIDLSGILFREQRVSLNWSGFSALLDSTSIRSVALQSLGLSLIVASLSLLLAGVWTIHARRVTQDDDRGPIIDRLWQIPWPPLALAIGVLSLSRLGIAGAEEIDWVVPKWIIQEASHLRRPWVLWVFAGVATQIPLAIFAIRLLRRDSHHGLFELARIAGANRNRAMDDALEWSARGPIVVACVTMIASASTAPALGLILFQTPHDQTLGPAVLLMAFEEESGVRMATIPACVSILLNLLAATFVLLFSARHSGVWLAGLRAPRMADSPGDFVG